jgi:sulfate permease, SulP family
VDLTFAIEVGVVLAAIAFMHRMAEAVAVQTHVPIIEGDIDDFARPGSSKETQRAELPPGVEVYQLRGPLFFGAATRLDDMLAIMRSRPQVFILRMGEVPFADATGARAIRNLAADCRRRSTYLILAEVQLEVREVLNRLSESSQDAHLHFVGDYREAVAHAKSLMQAAR